MRAPLHFLNADCEVDIQSFFSEVLLIEPDNELAELYGSILKRIVGDVTEAASGQEALDLIETNLIELVVLDSTLPDISAANLRNTIHHYRPGLPILAIADRANLEDGLHLVRDGAWDCVIKGSPDETARRLFSSIKQMAEKKLEEMQQVELRSERQAFCVAAQTAQDGLAVIGANGIVTFTNAAFKEFCYQLGATPAPDEPLQIVRLIEAHDQVVAEKLAAELAPRCSISSLWSAELRVEPKQSTDQSPPRFFDLTLNSVGIAGPEESSYQTMPDLRRHVLWVRDITERKERDKFQRELISTTSHDLKGPLGTIAFAAEMIHDSDDPLSEDTLNLINRIYSCAKKALTQIEQFLSARKIEDGVLNIEPKWKPASQILHDIHVDYSMMASTKNQTLLRVPGDENLEVYADPLALHRVLGNLVSNAIKYTPEGGMIQISAEQCGSTVRLSVSDTGSGIDASMRHKLFECYGRLKEHGQIEGTGLGLYIANNIVKAHNGNIEVFSQVGSGTTFVICLPLPPKPLEVKAEKAIQCVPSE